MDAECVLPRTWKGQTDLHIKKCSALKRKDARRKLLRQMCHFEFVAALVPLWGCPEGAAGPLDLFAPPCFRPERGCLVIALTFTVRAR
jgi:hypothetical protein